MNDLNEEIRQTITTADVLSNHMLEIIERIYSPPFIIVENHLFGKIDMTLIEVKNEHEIDWCHSLAEPTTRRLGRIYVSDRCIKVGRLKTVDFTLEDPLLFERVLKLFHKEVTVYLLTQADLMQRADFLCEHRQDYDRSSPILEQSVMIYRAKQCCKAVKLFDLRFLAHMFSEGYEGFKEIPDTFVISSEDASLNWPLLPAIMAERQYTKEEIMGEIQNPSKWIQY